MQRMILGACLVLLTAVACTPAARTRWKWDGRDLTPVARVMNALDLLLRQGQFQEAETVLDRGLALLSEPRSGDAGKPASHTGTPSGPPGPTKKAETPEALQAEIEALKPARPVWRAIAWKTCLLDALKEAREEKKPVLLWVLGGEPTRGRC